MARRRSTGGAVRRVSFAAAIVLAATVSGASAARATESQGQAVGPVVTVPAAGRSAEGRQLGPVSTAGIGGVLVAMMLWGRSRRRADVPA